MQTQTHPSPQHQSLAEMLPDAILVRIGISVAELCGLGDFLSLSLTSKHFYGLVMDSKETVTISEIIRIRTIEEEESSNNKIWLPSYSLRPLRLRTLQQLALYESLKKLNLLSENRLCTSALLDPWFWVLWTPVLAGTWKSTWGQTWQSTRNCLVENGRFSPVWLKKVVFHQAWWNFGAVEFFLFS